MVKINVVEVVSGFGDYCLGNARFNRTFYDGLPLGKIVRPVKRCKNFADRLRSSNLKHNSGQVRLSIAQYYISLYLGWEI